MPGYDELIAEAPQWLYAQNRDLVDNMPEVLAQAELQVYQRLEHDAFRDTINGLTLDTDGVIDLTSVVPQVFEVRSVRVQYKGDDSYVPLLERNIEYLEMLYGRAKPGRPLYYAEDDTTLYLRAYPKPSSALPLQIRANVEPTALSPSNKTNLVTQRYYRVIQLATFRQAAIYMKNEADTVRYTNELNDALSEANAQIARRRRDETETKPKDTSNKAGT